MKYNSEHIDSLIARYLSGEASHEEVVQLENWMNASKANKKHFDGIKFIHEKTVSSHRRLQFDTDKAWNTLHKKMHQAHQKPTSDTKVIKFNTKLLIGIAASITLLVGLFIWYTQFFTKSSTVHEIAFISSEKVERISLADSSKIVLNRNSKILYSSGYGIKNREVKLKGEAYFDVVHNAEMPFKVETDGVIIEDVGTAFNIKSLTDSGFVEVFVNSGSVRFYNAKNVGIVLKGGETAIYNKKENTFSKINSVDENKLSYETRKFMFDNTSLAEVLAKLGEVYQVKMEITNPKLKGCQITVKFDNENIDEIANIISETMGLTLIKKGGRYFFDGKGCE